MPKLVIADPGHLLLKLTGRGGAHWPPQPAGLRHHFMPRTTELRRLTLPGKTRRPDDIDAMPHHHRPLVQCHGPIWPGRRMKMMRGDPLGVWTGEVTETNDVALRLDNDDTCIWSLMNGRGAQVSEDDNGERQQPKLQALCVFPDTNPTHRPIETRIWPSRPPPFAVLATRPKA